MGSRDPPPLCRPICIRTGETPGALRPPSRAGSRSLLGSPPRWAALQAHLPPPLPAPASALPLLAGIGASLSRSRYLPPTLGLSTALSLSVPVPSECLSAPPSRPDSFWYRTWSVCLFTCPLSTCPSLISACLTAPQAPKLRPNSTHLYLFPVDQTPLKSHSLGYPGAGRTGQVRDRRRVPPTPRPQTPNSFRPARRVHSARRRGCHIPGYCSPLSGLNSERNCLATSSW